MTQMFFLLSTLHGMLSARVKILCCGMARAICGSAVFAALFHSPSLGIGITAARIDALSLKVTIRSLGFLLNNRFSDLYLNPLFLFVRLTVKD